MSHLPVRPQGCEHAPVDFGVELTFGERLERAMAARNESIRGLARKLAKQRGTKDETERRKLGRYLSDEDVPRPGTVAALREVLPATEEELPTPPQPRAAATGALHRLETQLSGGVRLTETNHGLLLEALAAAGRIEESQVRVHERLERLEQLVAQLQPPELAGESPGSGS